MPLTLFCTHVRDTYTLPPLFSDRMIVCSAHPKTKDPPALLHHIQVPRGSFDLTEATRNLPAHEQPEAIIVWSDATRGMMPRNLSAFDCPKILLVGDTQHLVNPITTMIEYASEESFDIVTLNRRQHAHFFLEAGIENVYWIPGLTASPRIIPFSRDKDPIVLHLGQSGLHHPHRRRVIESVYMANKPLKMLTAPPESIAEHHSKALINLNCSLNGDFNLRFLEVLASGSLLLTDRISEAALPSDLFEDGKHVVFYESINELHEKIDHYLKNADEANAIAEEGQKYFMANFRREQIINRFWNLVRSGVIDPRFDLGRENRIYGPFSGTKREFSARIQTYQFLQEQHRIRDFMDILFLPDAPIAAITDAADLMRLTINLQCDGGIPAAMKKALEAAGVIDRVHLITKADAVRRRWFALVTSDPTKCPDSVLRDYMYNTAIFAACLSDKGVEQGGAVLTKVAPPPPAAKSLDASDTAWTESHVQEYTSEFDLRDQVPQLNIARTHVGLVGRRVLEIGGALPRRLVLEKTGATQWIAIEYPDRRQVTGRADKNPDEPRLSTDAATFRISEEKLYEKISDYGVLLGSVSDLPEDFNNHFDRVISFDAFERILELPQALIAMYRVLRPGGLLLAIYSQIWSGHDGHHLMPIKDKTGHRFSSTQGECPIPPFGHLLMSPPQLYKYLLARMDAETAGGIVYSVYHAPNLNRLFTEDYVQYVHESSFHVEESIPTFLIDVPPDVQRQLEAGYPGRRHFGNSGLLLKLRKPWHDIV